MKLFYIKERNNPQFDSPYYVPLGAISKAEARRYERPKYGNNTVHAFNTKEAYTARIEELKKSGASIVK